ncbi:flagellar filament capping protein FliD [Thermovenabulum sp.]|uniref:flagellar filament capping protein FliD n=1 Tax=Thermovenabulum sp. TaxID=3100335 RepID=UPI003C7E8AB8
MVDSISRTLRIGGLASGMDIDQIVSDLMKIERQKVDKLYQQKQILEWQREDYRNINLKIKALYDSAFNMKLQGTYLKYRATVSYDDGTAPDSIFTATPGASAMPGTYSVEVKKIAQEAKIESSGSISKNYILGNILDLSQNPITVNDSNYKFVISLDGVEKTIELTKGVTYDGTTKTLDELKNDIQTKINATFGNDQITVSVENNQIKFSPGTSYSGAYKPNIVLKNSSVANILGNLGFTNGVSSKINIYAKLKDEAYKFENNPLNNGELIKFKINGKEFTFDFSDTGLEKNYTLNDVLNKINQDADAKVTAYYDAITDKIVIKSKETGLSAKVEIVNLSGNLFGNTGALKIASGSVDFGENALISINGIDISKPTNTFTISGIQFSLKKEAPGKTATLTIERDVDTVVETIKNFINTYNDTISAINSKLTEERYRDYLPLTDEQKKELKEDEIKKWEEKARSGLLRGDTVLSGLVNKLRQAVYGTVEGQPSDFDTLFDVGVKTGSYYEKGKLYIDEARLKEAISQNPEAVANLFVNITSSIYNIAKSGMDSITKKAGSSTQYFDNSLIAQNIRSLNDRISKMEEDLKKVEDRYWKQFTEMEKAIQSMNQQSMWLANQLGMYQSQ